METNNCIGKIAVDFIDSTLLLIGKRDKYTYRHSVRVGLLAGELGKKLGFSENYVNELQLAGRSHDLGKLVWHSDCFSQKPMRELEPHADTMFDHPTLSRRFLFDSLKSLDESDKKCNLRWTYWAWFHHWGYTEKYRKNPHLEGPYVAAFLRCIEDGCENSDIINTGIGIMHVADSFDAGVSERPYRNPERKSISTVLGELKNGAGEEYDPVAVQALENLVPWLRGPYLDHI